MLKRVSCTTVHIAPLLIDLRLIFARAIAVIWGQSAECIEQDDQCVHVTGQLVKGAIVGTSRSCTVA